MFAIALWDARTKTLIAARDRAGEKPLFYARTATGILFASEMKALLVRREVPRQLDLESLDQFLTYEYVLSPRTIFREHPARAGRALPEIPRRPGLGAPLLGCGGRGRARLE